MPPTKKALAQDHKFVGDLLEEQAYHDVFFSDRLLIDDDPMGFDLGGVLDELIEHGEMIATIGKWFVELSSPDAGDIHEQEHHACFIEGSVECCNREFNKKTGLHSVCWDIG